MAVLADTKARRIKPDGKPLPHGGTIGLTPHPSSVKGRGRWVFRYISPVTRKRRNVGLGTYPEVNIAEAARTAQIMREQLAVGDDPLEIKKVEPEKVVISIFVDAARRIHAELSPGWENPEHVKQWLSTLENYAFPQLGVKTLDSIMAADVAETLRPVWLTLSEAASRVKQRIHVAMQWGWVHGFCVANPVNVVDHLLPRRTRGRDEHQPAMPWRQLPLFVATSVYSDEPYNITRVLLLMMILTATHSSETRGMRWAEVDFHKWVRTISTERIKARLQHRAPLSRQAIYILENIRGLHDELVFPSPRKQQILFDMVLTSLLRKKKAVSDISGRVAIAYGFRSTFRDWCSEQGYSQDLTERAFAYTLKNKVEAVYHRTDLPEQRIPMIQAWADYVMSQIANR